MSQKLFLLDVATARQEMTDYIASTEKQLSVVKQVIEALKGYEGRNLHASVSKALAKKFPELKFDISGEYSWYTLNIRGDGFRGIQLQLCYKSEPKVFNIARIVELNQRYLLDEVRLVNYRETLKTIESRVKRYNAALRELYAANKNLGEGSYAFNKGDSLPSLYDASGRFINNFE